MPNLVSYGSFTIPVITNNSYAFLSTIVETTKPINNFLTDFKINWNFSTEAGVLILDRTNGYGTIKQNALGIQGFQAVIIKQSIDVTTTGYYTLQFRTLRRNTLSDPTHSLFVSISNTSYTILSSKTHNGTVTTPTSQQTINMISSVADWDTTSSLKSYTFIVFNSGFYDLNFTSIGIGTPTVTYDSTIFLTDISITKTSDVINTPVITNFTDYFSDSFKINFTPLSQSDNTFSYKYSLDGGNFTDSTPAATGSTITVSGISTNQIYKVVIQYSSLAGNSASSTAKYALNSTTAPAINITNYNSSTPSFDVTITPNVIGNLTDSGFKYWYSLNGGTDFNDSGTNTSTITISNAIVNNRIYKVVIQHRSDAGNSASSNANYALIGTTPAISSITNNGTSFSVFFTPNVTENVVGYIGDINFKYSYSINGGISFITPTTPISTESPIIITGISTDTIYRVAIKYTSTAGDSVYSDPSYALIPTTPTITNVMIEGSSLKVYFTPNVTEYADGYLTGNNFKYLYSLNGTSGSFTESTDKVSPITIAGITPNTIYNVAIKYTSDAGDSATSTPMYTFISTPPVITSITNEGSDFKVNFTQGVTGTPPTDTLSYWYSLDGGTNFKQASETISPITITGSLGNTIYRVVIKYRTNLTGDSSISNMVPAIRRSTNVQVASGVSSTTPTVVTNFTNSATLADNNQRYYKLDANFTSNGITGWTTTGISVNTASGTANQVNMVDGSGVQFINNPNVNTTLQRTINFEIGTYNLNFRALARNGSGSQQSLSVGIYKSNNSDSFALSTRTLTYDQIGMNQMNGTIIPNRNNINNWTLDDVSYKSYDFIVPSDGSYNLLFSSKAGNEFSGTITIFMRELFIENLTLPKPWGVYIAGHPRNTSTQLFDITGQGRHADITGGIAATFSSGSGNGAVASVPYVQGVKETLSGNGSSGSGTQILWPSGSIPANKFTICSITRYTNTTNDYRILTSSNSNMYYGHHNETVPGSVYHNGRGITNGSISTRTNWCVLCGTTNANVTIPNNVLVNNVAQGISTFVPEVYNRRLTINRTSISSGEFSDFAFQQLVIWDVSLNNYQLSRISTLQNNYLQTGTIKYPFAVISTPPVITNITNDGVSSFSVYFTQHVVGSADASFAYLYSIDGGTTYKDSLQTESPITISGIRKNMVHRVIIKHISSGGDSGPSNVVYTSINGSVPNNSVQYRNIDNSNIIRYYPFDTDVWDYSSGDGSNNATNTSSLVAFSNMPTGLGRGSARFPANPGQSFKIPNVTFGSGGITVAFWMALHSIPTTQTSIFEFTDASSSPTDTVGLRIGNGTTAKLMFVTGTNTTTDLSYTVPTNDFNQHHYAIVFKQPSNTVDLYIDGVFKTTTSVTYPSTSTLRTSCLIGKSNTLTTYINCTLNQFVMFNRELTSTEIGYLKTNPLDVRFTSNLTGLSSLPPVITSITNDGTSFKVYFTQDTTNGEPTAYFYSLDGGITFAPNSQPSSPITITSGIRSKIVYKVVIKNRNSAGDSKNSNIMAAILS